MLEPNVTKCQIILTKRVVLVVNFLYFIQIVRR